VLGSTYALTMGVDVVQPLAPGGWLGDVALNSRFGLLQHHLCSSLQDKSTLVLSAYVWAIFNRDRDSKQARGKQEHLDFVNTHLRDFNMDKAHIQRVFVPINTGSKRSSGEHWKALFLQVDSSRDYPAGSIWDMDSLKSATKDRGLYRQFCSDLYTFLRPAGTARLPTTDKLCKHHPYTTALPCVTSLPGRPLQDNSFDCGVFVASNVESMALRGTLNFAQADMVSLRLQYQLQFAMFCGPLSQVPPFITTMHPQLHPYFLPT
jgi:hypothetical protein